MTPKEKAQNLFDNYRNTILSFLSDKQKDENAIRCALIAVDEVLQVLKKIEKTEYKMIMSENFWFEVREEIEKL